MESIFQIFKAECDFKETLKVKVRKEKEPYQGSSYIRYDN
jgi:hypothetical protein